MRALLAKTLMTTLTALLTERFLLNLLALLAEWAVKRWGNDLAEDLFAHFKDALDRQHGQPSNLYTQIREDIVK